MIALADGDLVVPTDRATADRSCTDAETHATHPWTDGLRAWSCPGRGEIRRPWATVSLIALAAG